MDNANSEREQERKGALNGNASDIFRLMVEESRQSFFQRENFIRSLDTKGAGVVSLNAILFAIFSYTMNLFKNDWLYTPYILLLASTVLITACIWPREWDRQDCEGTIDKYGCWEFNMAATQLATNYATWDHELKNKYDKKLFCFEYALLMTLAAFLLEIIIFACLSF